MFKFGIPLNDSLITEVESLEKDNVNLVFSLPSNEAKGSPFMIPLYMRVTNMGLKNILFGIINGIQRMMHPMV